MTVSEGVANGMHESPTVEYNDVLRSPPSPARHNLPRAVKDFPGHVLYRRGSSGTGRRDRMGARTARAIILVK